MPGIITRRVPNRSISQPITGHDKATNQVLAPKALDSSPRLTPRSSVTGLRNTPKVKIRIAGADQEAAGTSEHDPPAAGEDPGHDAFPAPTLGRFGLFGTLAARYGAHKPRP